MSVAAIDASMLTGNAAGASQIAESRDETARLLMRLPRLVDQVREALSLRAQLRRGAVAL